MLSGQQQSQLAVMQEADWWDEGIVRDLTHPR
jgi:hypothetical protein